MTSHRPAFFPNSLPNCYMANYPLYFANLFIFIIFLLRIIAKPFFQYHLDLN